METMPPERVKSVLSTIMGSGHFSTLEHASYTFAVDGVSRALTHQLVRHRIASFNQQPSSYVKFKGDIPMVKPASVAADPECNRLFDEAAAAVAEAYRALVAAGIPAEDARYLLPNACETKIVITMNVRELLHFFERAAATAPVGNPRDGVEDAGACSSDGAVHLRRRRRALHPRRLPRG